MMKHLLRSLAVVLLAASPLAAQRLEFASSVRIDLNAEREEIRLTPGSVSPGARATNSEWRGAKAPFWITSYYPASADSWKTGSIVFTPDKSGTVVVQLKGPLVREAGSTDLMTVWVEFDDLRISGARLANPSFEDNDGETASDWYRAPAPAGAGPTELARIVTGGSAAGNSHVQVWHNGALHQSIQVVKDRSVILTFRHRILR